jgi:hypothetical protein
MMFNVTMDTGFFTNFGVTFDYYSYLRNSYKLSQQATNLLQLQIEK